MTRKHLLLFAVLLAVMAFMTACCDCEPDPYYEDAQAVRAELIQQ